MYTVSPIGKVSVDDEGFRIIVDAPYRAGLKGLTDYSHINFLLWFNGCDDKDSRSTVTVAKPYNTAPDALGVFATRSPARPNPVALCTAQVLYIDEENGVIGLPFTDAFDETPVLDIKPYVPSLDRVENPNVPDWCAHWPKSYEDSGDFDWESVFCF